MTFASFAAQAAQALLYYAGLVLLMRFAGKRLAGQTTTFDLLVLIALGVTLQTTLLEDGRAHALVFVVTVFLAHKGLTRLCAGSTAVRHLVRGKPRVLVRDGRPIPRALQAEGITEDELLAGLRKAGHDSVDKVELATLEETGQISAVGRK